MNRKILVMGLPGAGKTTLSRMLARRLNAVHFDADQIRAEINKDLAFTIQDRIEQARRMGWLCDQVVKAGTFAIADFVCPTEETRAAFGASFVVWVDRIRESRFADTNRLFVPPAAPDVRVRGDGSAEHWAEAVAQRLLPSFDPKRPTALFVGRWQPFHDGHRELVEEGLRRVGQVCIAVRNRSGDDRKNPYGFEEVESRIHAALRPHAGRYRVVPLPNITHIFYGRDVGYAVERLVLPPALEAISGTAIRALIMPGAGAAGMAE